MKKSDPDKPVTSNFYSKCIEISVFGMSEGRGEWGQVTF